MNRLTSSVIALLSCAMSVVILEAAPSFAREAIAPSYIPKFADEEISPPTHTYIITVTTSGSPVHVNEEQLRQVAVAYADQLVPHIPRTGYAVIAAYNSGAEDLCRQVITTTCDLLKVEQSPGSSNSRTNFTFSVRSQRWFPPVVQHDTVGEAPCMRPGEDAKTMWENCRYDVVRRFVSIFSAYEPTRHWRVREQ
jgi:hypothetical protein